MRRRLRLAALAVALALAVGCGGAVAAAPDAARPDPDAGRDGAAPPSGCAEFVPGVELGRVGALALDEISGIAASRTHEGVLWVHNDSGGGARVFAIDTGGALRGEWVLAGASAADWEDIALEHVDGGTDRLWIGDVGDNAARDGAGGREHVVIVRIDEPALPAEPAAVTLGGFDSIVLRYPDGPHDCEAIAVDGETGDLYVLAKENGGPSGVFVARAPLADGDERELEQVATIDTGSMVTGADISPDGRELLVRTYRSVLWWRRDAGEPWPSALARAGRGLPRAAEPQGESVSFAPTGEGYFTISEGESAPIWFYERRCE